MKSPEQLKGTIRNIAKEKGIHAQELLQLFMFERIIERLSFSYYRQYFILKGGLLISAMLGVEERTTMDMDTTIKGLPMTETAIKKILHEILEQPVNDDIHFQLTDLSPIREDDQYVNFRASLLAIYGKMRIPLKIDITTGDKITPREIQFSYPFLFENKTVPVMAYPIETILAEKYETIIQRNIENTRARDFYDLHLLYHLYEKQADWSILKQAVISTSQKRQSEATITNAKAILPLIQESTFLKELWTRYQAQNTYARNLNYFDIMGTLQSFTAHISL